MSRNKLKLTADTFVSELSEWKVKKEVTDGVVKMSLDNSFEFEGDAFTHFYDEAMRGGIDTPATLEDAKCAQSIAGTVKLNKGKADLKNCVMKKDFVFGNNFSFGDNNIFNCPANGSIQTFDGTIERQYYSNTEIRYDITSETQVSVDAILAIVGQIEDRTSNGYYVEEARIGCRAEEDQEDNGFYSHHEYFISVTYVRILSNNPIQGWLPFNGQYVFPVPSDNWAGSTRTIDFIGSTVYFEADYKKGTAQRYTIGDVSNTVNLNCILESIFDGYSYVSDFFNINPDDTHPNNEFYEFAETYLQELVIAQSYDIIRESAENDSFGNSGVFDEEKFIADLNLAFNTKIVIDNGIVRHEHITYFRKRGVDLFSSNNYDLGELDFDGNDTKEEKWTMAATSRNLEHYETKITYQGTTEEKQYNAKYMLTDFLSMWNNSYYEKPEYEDKFFILSTTNGVMNLFNEVLAIKNLVQELHSVGRPARNGFQDGESVNFINTDIGITSELSVIGSFSSFLSMFPEMAIKIKEGVFYIDDLEIDQDNKIKLTVKK